MDSLDVDGAWVITPCIRPDRRGTFHEWFSQTDLQAATGRSLDVAQASCSVSRRGIIRGIHFSDVPPGQAKYVVCTSGSTIDVIVDLRVSSPGYGCWATVPLDDQSRRAVFLSEGLGHAFVTLSDEATVLYLCSTPMLWAEPIARRRSHPAQYRSSRGTSLAQTTRTSTSSQASSQTRGVCTPVGGCRRVPEQRSRASINWRSVRSREQGCHGEAPGDGRIRQLGFLDRRAPRCPQAQGAVHRAGAEQASFGSRSAWPAA
jgi:dTDP-4-dehydrorhamnose 3,5-epimerase